MDLSYIKKLAILGLFLIFTGGCDIADKTISIENGHISLKLSVDQEGMPYIHNARWKDNGNIIFTGNPEKLKASSRLPSGIIINGKGNQKPTGEWDITEDSAGIHARFGRAFKKLKIFWNYRLIENSAVFETWIELKNTGSSVNMPWFPIWSGSLDFNASENTLKYWDALKYTPHIRNLTNDSDYILESQVYSSDPRHTEAHLPFWKVTDNKNTLYFGIGWCGGWKSRITRNEGSTLFDVKLPPKETRLMIKPDETISGPRLTITTVRNTTGQFVRSDYFSQKKIYAGKLYDFPHSRFPFIYNHWYATRFDLTGDFIVNQVAELHKYAFDVFVVDAGWYESVGNWRPAEDKFRSGEFEKALNNVKEYGIDVGIWSCPWLISDRLSVPSNIDTSGFYRKFVSANGIDMAESDFTGYLLDHINHLHSDYFMNWWKYDQEFMGDNKEQGNIRNIQAFQDALKDVRRKYPDLYIENCMSGGRMINDFTNTLAQIHWIKDGGDNGLEHARENIKTALGASHIIPLSKVERWTNRVNEIQDPELLKYYCRSAMIGVWGVSSDMYKLTTEQKSIMLNEIEHYRKLNRLKSENIYRIIYPKNKGFAGIIYYNASLDEAAAMIFRWKQKGELRYHIPLRLLKDKTEYTVNVSDTSKIFRYKGTMLQNDGLSVDLGEDEMSAIYYIE